MGDADSLFSYKHLKIKGVLTGYIVALVTSDVTKLTTICISMIGHFFDTTFKTAATD